MDANGGQDTHAWSLRMRSDAHGASLNLKPQFKGLV